MFLKIPRPAYHSFYYVCDCIYSYNSAYRIPKPLRILSIDEHGRALYISTFLESSNLPHSHIHFVKTPEANMQSAMPRLISLTKFNTPDLEKARYHNTSDIFICPIILVRATGWVIMQQHTIRSKFNLKRGIISFALFRMRDFCFIEWLGAQSRLYVRDFCGAIQIMAHSILDGAFPSRARDGRMFSGLF